MSTKALWIRILVGVLTVCPGGLAETPDGSAGNLPVTNHPKLGLVLEGGGALGLAHIGVIRWLEEHRLPINYVARTSMGGLVGGLYATGRSPQEVFELVDKSTGTRCCGASLRSTSCRIGERKMRTSIRTSSSSG